MFTEEGKIIGFVDVGSGGVLITDAVWASSMPVTTEGQILLDLRLPKGRIPVISVMKEGKRLLILDIDSLCEQPIPAEEVKVNNPVEIGESEEW